MLAKRGMTVNSETVRQWCFKFVQTDQNCGRVMQEFRDVIALIKILTESKHLPNRRALRKGAAYWVRLPTLYFDDVERGAVGGDGRTSAAHRWFGHYPSTLAAAALMLSQSATGSERTSRIKPALYKPMMSGKDCSWSGLSKAK